MINLLIADDHPIVREGLKRIVLECNDMNLQGEASDGNEVLVRCAQTSIDVILMDISMPGPGFLSVLKEIRLKFPEIHVLVLSIHPEDQYAIRALNAGASGYLTKSHTPDELANAIRHVHKGHKYISLVLAEKLLQKTNGDEKLHDKLSNREYQILCMIGKGLDTGTMAERLNLSPKTVSTYKSRVIEKMKIRSTSELVRYVIENGLMD